MDRLVIMDKGAGVPKVTVSAGESCVQEKEVMGDNVLSLSWTQYGYVGLDVGDYVDVRWDDWSERAGETERFWVAERYRPEMKNEREWKYEVRLYGIESMLKRWLVVNRTDGAMEPVFVLTAPPVEHVRMVVRTINAAMGTEDWKVGTVEGEENVVVEYEGKYCDEVLRELAEQVGVEWWIEGQTVNLTRCEHGEAVEMGYRDGLLGLQVGRADGVKFFTRLWPVGSSRNVDRDVYGWSRLMLPGGRAYVDVEGMVKEYGVIDQYERDAFADIYPRRVGKVGEVRKVTKRGQDGEDFDVWYFKDREVLDFNPAEQMIEGGGALRVSFQDGELAGLGTGEDHYFEVNWDEKEGEWEIVTIWPYEDGEQLPNGVLRPKEGDGYVLWNMKMPRGYYAQAEKELEAAVGAYVEESLRDVAVYKGRTDHVWMEKRGVHLDTGRRIRLRSEKYFGEEDGVRESRVVKLTRRMDVQGVVDVEIGDAVARGSMTRLGDEIEGVRSYARGLERSITLPDIIRTGDGTVPTDENVYSARRSDVNFWRKDRDIDSEHRVKGESLVSDRDAEVGGMLRVNRVGAKSGSVVRVDDKLMVEGDLQVEKDVKVKGGLEVVDDAVVRADLTVEGNSVLEGDTEWGNGEFEEGTTGAKVWKGQDGWHGQLDYLYVTKKFTVAELEVMHESHIGGVMVVSAANCVADFVEVASNGTALVGFAAEDGDGRKVYNMWKVGDLARCQSFNLSGDGTEDGVSNRYYWRQVVQVSSRPGTRNGKKYHSIVLSNVAGQYDEGSDVPMAGDEIVQMGHVSDEGRQGVIMLASVGNGASGVVPYVRIYRGVGTEELADDGTVKRSRFQLPKARIDLNPWSPRLDVAELSITATDGESRTVDEILRERDGRCVLVVQGESEDVPGTDAEFIGECLRVLGLDAKEDLVGAFYVTTDWRIFRYGDDFTWREDTDAGLRSLLEEMRGQRAAVVEQAVERAVGAVRERILEILDDTGALEVVDGMIQDYTDGRFVEGSTFNMYKEGIEAYTRWLDPVKRAAGQTGLLTYLESLFLGVDAVSFDSEGNVRNIDRSGLVASTAFAGLFAEQTTAQGVAKSAEVAAMVRDGMSEVVVSADRVFIESGDRLLGNYFSLDGERGDVVLHDLLAHNVTLSGVLNNLIQYVTPENIGEYGKRIGANHYLLDPLRIGMYVVLVDGVNSSWKDYGGSVRFDLPCAEQNLRDASGEGLDEVSIWGVKPVRNGAGERVWMGYSLEDMRMCVGKRIYFLPNWEDFTYVEIGCGVPMVVRRDVYTNRYSGSYVSSSSATFEYGTMRENFDDMGQYVEYDRHEVVKLYNEYRHSGNRGFVMAECRMMPRYDIECIGWSLMERGNMMQGRVWDEVNGCYLDEEEVDGL